MNIARMLYFAALTASAIAVPSIAQVQNPPASARLTPEQQAALDSASAMANQAATDAASAKAQASAAQTTAQAAATPSSVADAITASTPSTCGTPSPDSYGGSPGTASRCMPRADASRPTQVQSSTATTTSDGTFSGSWPVSFVSAPMYAHAEINSATTPFICQMTGTTTTGYNGKCFAVASTTLPGTLLALNGLVVSPIVNATAGQTVKIIARQ